MLLRKGDTLLDKAGEVRAGGVRAGAGGVVRGKRGHDERPLAEQGAGEVLLGKGDALLDKATEVRAGEGGVRERECELSTCRSGAWGNAA